MPDYLTPRCRELAERPDEELPSCPGSHLYLIVFISPRLNRWRCERCLRYLEQTYPDPENEAQGSLF